MATNVVPMSSDLKRKAWMREGLIQAASKSFWSPYTGTSRKAVVYQKNNSSAAEGHTVVFDFDGNLSGRAIKGKDTAYGKGEQKRKFSDKITVDRYRLVVDNGDKFDAVDVGNLSTAEHADSRTKLSDLFIRWKDQMLFDVAQGFSDNGQGTLTHSIQINASSTKIGYDNLVAIEQNLRTGTGFKTGAFGSTTNATQRAPLSPYRLSNGRSVWLVVVGPYTAANMKGNTTDAGVMRVMRDADVRGPNNQAIRGVLGQIGQLVFVEAEAFFGFSAGKAFSDTEVEIAGLRQYDGTKWSGETGYNGAQYERCLILGEGALMMPMGKMPDYKFQESTDFGIKSESAVEFWTNAARVKMTAEQDDYKQAKVAGLDFGVVALDVKVA
jgi:hypothetical protein